MQKKKHLRRLDAYKRNENWVTIRGVHVLLDKDGNVINNFKDPEHKLKNLRFVDAVSSHTEGGKKVVDAPVGRLTHEEKFNGSMDKIAFGLGAGSITKADAQKRMANAFANLEQGAVVSAGGIRALKMGKGVFKVKGEKGDVTAKQLAERVMSGVSVSEASGSVSGMPSVKAGTNANTIQKGSKRITHVATNALEELYNKYKSNKYSRKGLQNLARGYLSSLPKGSELTVGGYTFTKNDDAWSVNFGGETHDIAHNNVANILLNSMATGYAGGTLSAKIPEAAAGDVDKVEKAAEKIEKKAPEKAVPEKPKSIAASLKEAVASATTSAEKQKAVLDYLSGLPDGTAIAYEAVHKDSGKHYIVKGVKNGDKIEFFKKEAPLHSMAYTIAKKLDSGLAVGGVDEVSLPEGSGSDGAEKAPEAPKPAKKFASEKMEKLASIASDPSKYTPEKKAAAQAAWSGDSYEVEDKVNAKYKAKSLAWFSGLASEVRGWFKSYTASGFTDINNSLRNAGSDGMTAYDAKRVNAMTSELAKNTLAEPMMLRRGISLYTMAKMFGVSESDLAAMGTDESKIREMFSGNVGVENGFSSCGATRHAGYKKAVNLEIYCPEGTEAVFANPWSEYSGPAEFEMILQRGTAYRVTDVSVSPKGVWNVKCEVVAQRVMVDNFGEDISDKLKAHKSAA